MKYPTNTTMFMLGTAALFCAVVGYLWMSVGGSTSSVLESLGVAPRHERFTELFITDAPRFVQFPQEGTTLSFSYTVVNHERREVRYHVDVFAVTQAGVRKQLASHVVSLADTEQQTFADQITYTTELMHGVVYVRLPDQGVEVHMAIVPRM